jgi:ribosomal protein L17
MKKFIELFELVIQSAKKTKDAKKLKEITKIGEELSVLAKNPDKITEAQVAILSDKLKEFQQGAITKVDEIEAPSVTNRPQGKSADMYDSAERSIQFVAEKTGLSFEEARLAIMEKMNDGYAIGDPKRRGANELASIKAYLDVNLDYSATDAIQFLEDIEEIAFSGSIDLASDTAKNVSKQNAKEIIDSSNPGEEFGETLIDFDKATPEDFKKLDDTTEQGPMTMTLEDTFKNVPPERRAMMEEMYAPIIEEQKIIEATQKEIQQTAAKIQDLIEQGRVDEAEALAESLKDFQTQLKSTDSALDATIIPPNRTLNAKGGSIGISSLFKRK